MSYRVLAVDQSLTSTGYAYRRVTGQVVVEAIVQKEARGMRRLHTIASHLLDVGQRTKASLLVVEGYAFSFGKGASRSHSLGEIGGIIKYSFWHRGTDLLVVPPNSLKLFMLGRYKTVKIGEDGKKQKVKVKDLVKQAAERHAGRSFATSDQADAYGLLMMGEMFGKAGTPNIEEYQAVALAGCEFIPGQKV